MKMNNFYVAEYCGKLVVHSMMNKGTVKICFEKVLFSPELPCNLLSVKKLDEKGLKIVFKESKVNVFTDDKLVAFGKSSGKLYAMNFFLDSRPSANYSLGNVRSDLELWHRRFGHIGESGMKEVIKKGMIPSYKMEAIEDVTRNLCESCIQGKMSRKPFSKSTSKNSERILELVHTDLCGPVKQQTWDCKKYCMSFIDDFTRFAVVYLLKSKDEAFKIFKYYEAKATGKYGVKIATLRCDNGTEYKNQDFTVFCAEKGIHQEFTPIYTPECNGIAERLNRTLIEKCCSMLFDSGLDQKFWGEALLAAAYIRNRTPSRSIDYNIPVDCGT